MSDTNGMVPYSTAVQLATAFEAEVKGIMEARRQILDHVERLNRAFQWDDVCRRAFRVSVRVETEYFRLRCCLNGNLHVEFRRLDLVKALNRRCGNSHELPGRAEGPCQRAEVAR